MGITNLVTYSPSHLNRGAEGGFSLNAYCYLIDSINFIEKVVKKISPYPFGESFDF